MSEPIDLEVWRAKHAARSIAPVRMISLEDMYLELQETQRALIAAFHLIDALTARLQGRTGARERHHGQ